MSKEFLFTREDFKQVQKIVFDNAGIKLSDHKFEMVYGRLARRLRATGIRSVNEYLDFAKQDEQETIQFTNALTTNLTYFFRESHHFEFIESKVVPQVIDSNKSTKKVRIWSAGCSSGEEPYSIAYSIRNLIKNQSSWDIKILATDLDTEVLKKAKNGIYISERIESMSADQRQSLFNKTPSGYCVKDDWRRYIFFKQLNLMNSWPMRGKFEVIFCRNVLIYFDRDTQQKLIGRFRELLAPNGYLILGHSESIGAQGSNFKALGKTIFQRSKG
ncbi:MAG: protein-glutamate O-methyltransferase [Gammaproteobacteria bacterium]|nr:protein-glutamate O-methyltransferase [Gammaproteobacteria bacterium]